LREFFQWNIDIIGIDDVLADAEIIFCAVDYLQSVGLTQNDIVVRISSRKMLAAVLRAIGVAEKDLEMLYALLDKRSKIPADAFVEMLVEKVSDAEIRKKILKLMDVKSIEQIGSCTELSDEAKASIAELQRLFEFLSTMGIAAFCKFDIGIVRGLAYYTGIVFEIYDKGGQMRAIGGGGRYDNLLQQFGGPAITATGFGIGDCVLGILLEEKGLLSKQLSPQKPDYFVSYADEKFFQKAIEIAARIRRAGKAAIFGYKPTNLAKQLKQASTQKVANCVIIGQELIEKNELIVKDMNSGQQQSINLDEFFRRISS
jgi:histidyl-tRNA synthetase